MYNKQEQVEYEVENAIQEMQLDDWSKLSAHKKGQIVRSFKSGWQWLQDNHPDSYILEMDVSDLPVNI